MFGDPQTVIHNSRALMRLPSLISSQRNVNDTTAQIAFVSWLNESDTQKRNRALIWSFIFCCKMKSRGSDSGQFALSLYSSGIFFNYFNFFCRTATSYPTESAKFFNCWDVTHTHTKKKKTLTKVKFKGESCSFWLCFGHLYVVYWVWLCLVYVRAYLQTWSRTQSTEGWAELSS